jgi:hypothetical protein
MSTRCNIKVADGYDTLWFYRHSDGYPEGALPTLKKFMGWVKDGLIRENVGQASGWLIVIGHKEYSEYEGNGYTDLPSKESGSGWKVGAYEPTTGEHGDIEYLYELDLRKKKITVLKVGWPEKGGFEPRSYKEIEVITEFEEVKV